MFRLTAITLAAFYVVLAVFGHDPEETGEAVAAPPEAPAPAPTTEANAPDALTTPGLPAATVTPARFPPMPGPALKPGPEYRPAPAPLSGRLFRVATNRLNVRAAPSASAPVTGQLGRGAEIRVVTERDGWAQIRIEGDSIEGWVSRRLLRPAD
ncbi:SH3 domain-containing protein [Paenirhodobacter ferrireducens]|nr:SH3 domain-containing protein [Sinirhodobacter ferrireducens]